MIVLVCGGRAFSNRELLYEVLDECHALHTIEEIVQGGAEGADAIAVEWAKANEVDYRTFVAKWKRHGKSAGPILNRRMLNKGRPDLVFAMPGGRGTADMVGLCRACDIRVSDFRE